MTISQREIQNKNFRLHRSITMFLFLNVFTALKEFFEDFCFTADTGVVCGGRKSVLVQIFYFSPL